MLKTYSNPEPHGVVENEYTRLPVVKASMVGWLVVYGFTSRSRIFHLYGDVTIAGEGPQNLGLCSALRAFEQGGIRSNKGYEIIHLTYGPVM
jgi:hypothetical protein